MSIIIIGSGFAGLCMGIELRKAGIEDFLILERGASIGGTWRDNDYPGCACDVQSHVYSYSFEPNPHWQRMFAPQKEIRAYIERVARKYGLMPHIRLNRDVESVRYDEAAKVWCVSTRGAEGYRANVVIGAFGNLSNAAFPMIRGLDTFTGPIFHSSQWKHDCDLTGKRVAVIGTGSSAIQFVPHLQKQVGQLYLFQRTPPWVMRKPDRTISAFEQSLFEKLPMTQRLISRALYWACESRIVALAKHPKLVHAVKIFALRHLKSQIKDPELRKKLTPNYALGCKRILLSNDYYPALAQPNVEVVTEPIREVRTASVVTQDGVERAVDVVILGTGFTAQEPLRRGMLIGRHGIDVADRWNGSPEAYKGATVDGYPNFFFLLGPNTGLGHSSVIYMIESLAAYIVGAIQQMRANGWRTLDVKPEAVRAFNADLQRKVEGTVWQLGGCRSWYQNEAGRNTALWPDFTFKFRQMVAQFDVDNYVIEKHAKSVIDPTAHDTEVYAVPVPPATS